VRETETTKLDRDFWMGLRARPNFKMARFVCLLIVLKLQPQPPIRAIFDPINKIIIQQSSVLDDDLLPLPHVPNEQTPAQPPSTNHGKEEWKNQEIQAEC
jgi:hypothetical protein